MIAFAGSIAVVGAACSANSSGSSGSGGSSSTTGSGGGTTVATTSSSSGQGGEEITVGVGSGGSSGSGVVGCENPPDVDMDGDGWTGADGDCNDCDKNVNPGAIEVKVTMAQGDAGVPDPADEDCDGMTDNEPKPCDDGLALADVDPANAAKAIDLCQTTEENPAAKKDKKWGVIESIYVGADGKSARVPGLQVGLQSSFGPNVTPRLGKAMLGLSSGHMRVPGQSGVCMTGQSCVTQYNGPPPANFPQAVPGCPPKPDIHDDISLQLKVRAPTNATGYKFNFKFYSFEYPEWVCSDYNDQFVALVNPPPQGAINGNISFDNTNHPVSVNIAFFDVCDPSPASKMNYALHCSGASCPAPPNPYCPSGIGELIGTGMAGGPGDPGDGGATSWLQTQAPVDGGSIITIRFAIWDTGDNNLDSSVLVDAFQWIANGGTVKLETKPPA
ncbi:MAG: choice-of-anchor L domain-containing protein [Byssovorax sp.]